MLETRRLTKHFGGVKALTDVSLAVGVEEIVGLIGPNGSGKTTLLNVVSGVMGPTSGHVVLDERDIGGWSSHRVARARIARTFQNIRLFGRLSVRDNVVVGALGVGCRRSAAAQRAERLLDELGLAAMADLRAATLAYGDQRRVELARALAADPAFLLLDEPAAGLNESESDTLLALIGRIRADRGCGVLVVDHDMRLIMRLCDRIHVLDAGNSLFEGTPGEVRGSSAVAAAYLGEGHAGA